MTEGQHPTTEQQLVRHQPAKTYEHQFGREVTPVEHRAGWNGTFSAPRSVSLTALLEKTTAYASRTAKVSGLH
ncbi:relaxase domain-containing protein [Granulicella aggregans]|uniref:relaxase domain-containing protein n=1 Tax=Granulicella aggregans TaxID=474949 RepID=UPI003D7C1D0B